MVCRIGSESKPVIFNCRCLNLTIYISGLIHQIFWTAIVSIDFRILWKLTHLFRCVQEWIWLHDFRLQSLAPFYSILTHTLVGCSHGTELNVSSQQLPGFEYICGGAGSELWDKHIPYIFHCFLFSSLLAGITWKQKHQMVSPLFGGLAALLWTLY